MNQCGMVAAFLMPTPRHTLRGLAALCLLCVLPRLGATVLTISETTIHAVSAGNAGYNDVGTSATWHIPSFDPAQGVLQSVTWRATAIINISAFSQHVYWQWPLEEPTAKEFTPYTRFEFVAYPFGLAEFEVLQADDYSADAQRLVQPYEIFGHQHEHTLSFEKTTMAPADLARYYGALPPIGDYGMTTAFVVRGYGYGRYGSMQLSGTIATTIEYAYSISDAGYSAALMTVALLGLMAVRRIALHS